LGEFALADRESKGESEGCEAQSPRFFSDHREAFSLAEYFLLTVVSDGLGAYGIWENLRSHKWQKNQEHRGLISSGLTKETTDKLFYLI